MEEIPQPNAKLLAEKSAETKSPTLISGARSPFIRDIPPKNHPTFTDCTDFKSRRPVAVHSEEGGRPVVRKSSDKSI
jgi:hypothetical protein